jgi:hypothetical protein
MVPEAIVSVRSLRHWLLFVQPEIGCPLQRHAEPYMEPTWNTAGGGQYVAVKMVADYYSLYDRPICTRKQVRKLWVIRRQSG